MITDIKMLCERLLVFCEISRDVCRTLETALAWVRQAQDELRSLDSAGAQEAYALTVRAHDAMCAVVYGWANDVERDSLGLKRAFEV